MFDVICRLMLIRDLRSRRSGETRRWSRCLGIQRLETRINFSAEGAAFDLSRSFDTSGILGDVTATIDWGDGSAVTQTTLTDSSQNGKIKLRFDYSLDTNNFFADPSRRAALELAGRMASSRLNDSLLAITPSGVNTWTATVTHPTSGVDEFPVKQNMTIAANEVVVYVGARDLGRSTLALGGPGGQKVNGTQDWINTVFGRGQAGALTGTKTDFAPWGGSLTFNPTTNWYFGLDESALPSDKTDFYTVATHELMHLLGFGTSDSWKQLISSGTFTGANSKATYEGTGNVPLAADTAHWLESITVGGQKTIMGPLINTGKRELPTKLDLAGLDDLGWDVLSTTNTLSSSHVYADNGSYPITISLVGSSLGKLSLSSTATITNVAPTLTVPSDRTVAVGESFNISKLGNISDPGFANSKAATPTAETFTYTVNWGDGSQIDSGNATIDRLGSASQPTLASFNGGHRYAAAGTYSVTVRVADDDGGTSQQTFQITAVAPAQLTLTLDKTSITEDAGEDAATLTISLSGAVPTSDVTVQLTSSDTSELSVPASAVIKAGTNSITVPVTAVDDNLSDGDQSVTITAAAPSVNSGTVAMTVADVETLTATFTNSSLREDAADDAFFVTITRSNTDVSAALNVAVDGNVASRITLASPIVIPAGQRSVQVPVVPINDDIAQLSLPLSYRFTAAGYVQATATFTLLDDEKPKFQNPNDPYDVNPDGIVTALDALRVINAIARRDGKVQLDPDTDSFGVNFVDVTGDYLITPLDALRVINEIPRRRALSAEGEGQVAPPDRLDMQSAHDDVMRTMSESLLF